MAFFRKLRTCTCGAPASKEIIVVDNTRWRICCNACGPTAIAEVRGAERERARSAMASAKIRLAESLLPSREMTEQEADDVLILGQRQNAIAHANFMGWDVSNVPPDRVVAHVADRHDRHLKKIGVLDHEGRSVWDETRRKMAEDELIPGGHD